MFFVFCLRRRKRLSQLLHLSAQFAIFLLFSVSVGLQHAIFLLKRQFPLRCLVLGLGFQHAILLLEQ